MDVPEHDASSPDPAVNRLQRRKQKTRSALLRAAQRFIAEGKLNAPILEITQAADVGMGSFYNHFSSKEELFDAAVADALDNLGALLDGFTDSINDAAEAFATNFRLTGRLFRDRPEEAALLLANGGSLILSDRGLSPRALRDIAAAIDRGRFTITDAELGLAIAGGMLFGLTTLLRERPERDTDATVDEVTERLLRTLGMTASQAKAMCRKPLPDTSALHASPADWPTAIAREATSPHSD